MLGVTHFAVGATGGTLLTESGDVAYHKRLPLIVSSGIFAMLPDSNKIVNTRAADVLHDTVLSNLFWFHGALDALETAYPELEGAVALLFLLCAAVFTCFSESTS
jgi:hypothetical protein